MRFPLLINFSALNFFIGISPAPALCSMSIPQAVSIDNQLEFGLRQPQGAEIPVTVTKEFTDKDDDGDWLLGEFRDAVGELIQVDFMKTDGYLLRWLVESDYNMEDAVDRFKKTLEWRRANSIDEIFQSTEDFSRFDNAYPHGIEGFDIEGRPVLWAPVGTYNFRALFLSGAGEFDAFMRYIVRMLEYCEWVTYFALNSSTRTSTPRLQQMAGIADLAGFSLTRTGCFRCLEKVPELLDTAQGHYPFLFHKVFQINTPAVFATVMAVARPLFTPTTRDALQVFGHDRGEWGKALLEQIPVEELRVAYGGTKGKASGALLAGPGGSITINSVRLRFLEELPHRIQVQPPKANPKPRNVPKLRHSHHHHYLQLQPTAAGSAARNMCRSHIHEALVAFVLIYVSIYV